MLIMVLNVNVIQAKFDIREQVAVGSLPEGCNKWETDENQAGKWNSAFLQNFLWNCWSAFQNFVSKKSSVKHQSLFIYNRFNLFIHQS